MDINSSMEASLASIKQAIGTSNLRNSLRQDEESVNALLKGMEENTKIMESSVNPHKGKYIDMKI